MGICYSMVHIKSGDAIIALWHAKEESQHISRMDADTSRMISEGNSIIHSQQVLMSTFSVLLRDVSI